jgi:hypothetical protein
MSLTAGGRGRLPTTPDANGVLTNLGEIMAIPRR